MSDIGTVLGYVCCSIRSTYREKALHLHHHHHHCFVCHISSGTLLTFTLTFVTNREYYETMASYKNVIDKAIKSPLQWFLHKENPEEYPLFEWSVT